MALLAGWLPATPLSAAVPKAGRSGLPWNAGVFTGNGNAAAVSAFATWRGRPVDAVLFFAVRDTWDNLKVIDPDVLAFPGIKVIALPPFPESLGAGGLAPAAAGHDNSWWKAYGQMLVASGLNNNRTVIRLGWELNGNWYAWSATTGREQSFINAWRNVVKSIRAGGATAVQFDWCVNKGNQSNTNAWLAYPGDAYVDVLGLDFYDFWDPIFSNGGFTAQAAKSPSLDDLSAYCTAHHKQIALDEWGVVHDAHGGNDNPFFIQKIWDWLRAHAALVAYETTFDDPGAPSTFHHKLSPPEGPSWNPKASALYQQLWGRSAGVPKAPTGVTVLAGNGRVTLAWTAAPGALSYRIYRGVHPGGEAAAAVASGVANVTYASTGLTNAATYYFVVKAVNGAGVSAASHEVSAMPVALAQPLSNGAYTFAPAKAPTLRLAVAGGGAFDGANVALAPAAVALAQEWTITSVSGSTYRISPAHAPALCLDVPSRSTASGANVQAWTYAGRLDQHWTLAPFNGGYTLSPTHATSRRLNVSGSGSAANVNQATANSSSAQTWLVKRVPVPAAPGGLKAKAGKGRVVLSWKATAGATSYRVYRGTEPGGESATPIATGLTSPTCTSSGLSNGTTYYFRIKAVGPGGYSNYSSEVSATPSAAASFDPGDV